MTQQRAGVWSVLTATLLLHGCALLCPERADPETVYAELKPFSALARRAAIDERDPANAVVIPESAYLEATRGRTPQSSDEIAQTRARQLNALGNDPTALGMLAPARHSSAGLQFSGSVFIVVRNPTFVAFGRGVEITDYYVAVQELSGRSAWVGSGARVLLGAPPGSSSAACCGPSIMCGSPGPLRGPCGGDASCVADGIGIGGLDHPALAARSSLGLPMIGIQFQGGRFTDVPEQCATVVNPSCAISVPVCGPADNGYVQNGDGSADVPVGSSACGDHTRSASFPGIPPVCLIALTTGEGPYCGGLSGDDRLPLPEAVDGLPPGCRLERSVEGSNVCSPSSERKALKELEQLALRAMFAGGIGSRCEAQSTGFSICTTCTAAGCSQTARRDVQLIAGPASGFEPVLFCPDGSQPPGEVVPCTEGSTGGGSSGSKPPDSTPPPPSGGTNPPPGQPPPQPTTTSNGDPPPPPIDNPPPPPVPEHEPKFRDFTGKPPSSMDPVSVGDGAFAIDVADLNFDGPVRPLSFRRHYHSQRDERSSLGSNWAHNWDATVTPVSVANARAWMLPFCAGAQSRPSCLVLRQGDGSSELFYLDYGTMLYLPQAGSTTTLATTDRGGWAARSPWGDVLAFDSEGALIEDRDRFGNGFHIVNEPTPMGAAFAALCSASALAARHETPASRRCAVLSFLVGRAARPLPGDAWQISMTDFASLLAALPAADGDTNGRILYGVQQLLALAALGPALEPPDGGRATRVRRVVDDLGRELRFDYQRAVADAEGNLRFNVPGVELLTRVRGPEGTLLTFTYGRPELYPAESAESFLVGLRRHDSPVDGRLVAAPDRQIAYEYLWPGTAAAADVALYAGRVYDAYLAYYRTFVGCAGKLSNNCGNEFLMPGIAPGNAEVAARIQRNQYLGRVADNIMTVSADGQIESETRYALDPWQARFDRVYAQRYGSSSAVTPTWPIAADRPEDHWQSTLPKATREYASAGPRPGGGDETVAFLPAELRSRYPLDSGDNDETVPPPLPRQVVSPLHPARELSTALIPVCQGELSQPLFEALPGVRNKVEYYPPPDVSPPIEASGRLPAGSLRVRRTRLSCDQLAIHQLGDPGHNDLVSSLEPDLSTPTNLGDQFATRISGRRAVVAADSNRICEWTREVDRNGDVSLFGLNYRGQPLVEAHLQRSNLRWAYFERLYNADGLMVEERRPTEGAAAWTASAGYTAYTFDEIDSSAHQGWDGWLPAYWARRGNLLRTETRSASGAVRDLEPSGDAVVETIGRYSTVQYEPLFNQQWRTQSGAVAMAGTAAVDRPEKWSEVEFDYQEAGHLDTRFDGLLDELRPWGYSWFRNTEGTGYDYPRIAQWQLPLPLLGRDVNGDGVIGFGYVAGGRVNGKAAAVRVVHYVPGESELLPTLFTWAPHGLPAQVVGPDGATTLFRYYPAGGATTDPSRLYGDGTTPAPERAAATYAGLLAEVKVTRFGLVEDANLGPAQAPCEALRGPYQWLLPASCGDPRIELRALGVPESVVAGILQGTAASADRWRTTVLSYTDLGRSHTVTRDGRSSRQQRDTDGRVTLQRDPLNNSTLTTYSVKGLPEYVVMRDTVGALMTEMRLRYDEEGRVRRHCTALLVGGCPVDGNGEPMSEAVSQSFYFPEGELALSIDPEGLASRFERDENGRAVTVLRGADGSPDPARSTRLGYTLDGQLASAFFGTETTVVAAESLFYDGLQRLREHIDSRGSHWYFGHSSRDLMVRRKIDTADFGQAGADPRWNTQWRYDLFGRLVAKFENGIEVHSLDLDRNGRPLRERELGRGTRFLRYDLEGRLLWTRDASGDEEIRTFRPVQGERTSSTLQRCCGSARTVATSTTELLDGLGRVVESVDSGAIDQRRRSFVRDGRGSILNATDAAGLVTLYEPNLVGWVQARKQQRNLSIPAVFDDTVFKYDRMGRTVKVTDAANEASEYAFNAYGELVGEKLPGLVPALRAYAYDALGRLSSWTRAGVQITRHYDNRGDPIQDVLEGSSAQMISKRTFDDLGRLSDATEANPGVTELPASRRTVFNTWRYDSLGRLARESVRIGEGPERSMTYDWSLELGSWRLRTTGSPGSTLQWQSSYDVSGRLTSRRRIDSPGHDFAAEFEWLGTSLVNQASRDAGQVSALRQHRDLDNFGAPLRWTYSGIDVDANGTPLSQAEGDAYCGSVWTVARCGAPLFVAETIRDVAGREVSIQQHWGLPLSAGTPAPNAARGFEWLGVAYGGLGAPATVWEHRGAGGVGTDSLPNHRVTAADVRRVAATAAAVQWDYARREAVGDLLSISQPGQGLERWSHPGNYNPGHELAQVRLAGQARAVTHDTDRRIVSFGDLQLGYDPRGNLATAYRSGQLIEAYLHDARGRLVQSLRSLDGMDRDEFLVDGDQIAAAFDATGALRWSATWGAEIDQLLEWSDASGVRVQPVIDTRHTVTGVWNAATKKLQGSIRYTPEGRAAVSDSDERLICEEAGLGQICALPVDLPFALFSAWRSNKTGMSYLRNRWYSPELAQFTAPDPQGYGDSFNLYAFAGFDSINGRDPYGLQAAPNLTEPLPGPQPTPLRLVPNLPGYEPAAPGPALLRAAFAAPVSRLTLAAGLLIPSNLFQTYVDCTDGICTNSDTGTSFDEVTRQELRREEVASRSSIPIASKQRPGYDPSALSGPNYKDRLVSPDSDPDICGYCGKLAPGTIEHIIARVEAFDLGADKALTKAEAKKIVDALNNLIKVCKSCNSRKSGRPLGTTYEPPNPDSYVKQLLAYARNPALRWILRELGLADESEMAGAVLPVGKSDRSAPPLGSPTGSASASCTAKDLSCH